MRLGAALVVGFVATTAAFLIPPQAADVVKDTRFEHVPQPVKDLLHSLLEDKTETIDLACPNCPGIAESGRGEEKAIVCSNGMRYEPRLLTSCSALS